MTDRVLALGTAVLCASGCVWYLPAVADVRAGADRPRSQRSAAVACLIAWGTLAAAAVLLLTPVPWTGTAATTAAGLTAAAGVRVRARLQRGREQREESRRWAALGTQAPAVPERRRASRVFVACAVSGLLLTATAAATVLLVVGPTA